MYEYIEETTNAETRNVRDCVPPADTSARNAYSECTSERCTCIERSARACETRENTIKAAPGKNTNLNGTKEICSHIRCIRMNGARLLQFTIYCFATFFSADASGIRSLLPISPPLSLRLPFTLSLPLSFSLRVTKYEREETKRKGGKERGRKRERERERKGEHGRMAGQDDPGGKAVIAKKDNARED